MHEQSIILLGHGSKSVDAKNDFNFIVDAIKLKSGFKHVYGAHMELTEPSLEMVVSELYGLGQRSIIILPYFLFNGNHIKEDIPAIIDGLVKLYPDLEVVFGSPIGQEPLMADIMLKKIGEMVVS